MAEESCHGSWGLMKYRGSVGRRQAAELLIISYNVWLPGNTSHMEKN
jgi:hypothetical protein